LTAANCTTSAAVVSILHPGPKHILKGR
jgi:hypothetical protein